MIVGQRILVKQHIMTESLYSVHYSPYSIIMFYGCEVGQLITKLF